MGLRIVGLIAVENALFQWEEGERRLRDTPEPARSDLERAVRVVLDELRRRLGSSFSVHELAAFYARDVDWASDLAQRQARGPTRRGSSTPPSTATRARRSTTRVAGRATCRRDRSNRRASGSYSSSESESSSSPASSPLRVMTMRSGSTAITTDGGRPSARRRRGRPGSPGRARGRSPPRRGRRCPRDRACGSRPPASAAAASTASPPAAPLGPSPSPLSPSSSESSSSSSSSGSASRAAATRASSSARRSSSSSARRGPVGGVTAVGGAARARA